MLRTPIPTRPPLPYTPNVTTPSLPGKNRPSSRGPETQGVTPTIRVGVLSGRLSSCNFFIQPLNPTDTCKEQMDNIRLRLLRVDTRPRPGMGVPWFSQGAWSCYCRQGDLLQRGCRAVVAVPCGPDGGAPSGFGSGCHPPQAGRAAFPSGQTPGEGRSPVSRRTAGLWGKQS